MALSPSPSPLVLVRRITTAVLTAAAVGAGFVAVHLAGDRQAALASSSVTQQNLVSPQDQAPDQDQWAPDSGTQNPGTQNPGTQNPGTQNPGTQDPGTQGFAPVGPLTGGSGPQGSTHGS